MGKRKTVLCEYCMYWAWPTLDCKLHWRDDLAKYVASLYNHEQQSKISAEAPLLPSLADKIARLHILMTTQRSVDLLNKTNKTTSESAAGQSQYKKEKGLTKTKELKVKIL